MKTLNFRDYATNLFPYLFGRRYKWCFKLQSHWTIILNVDLHHGSKFPT